MADYSKPKAATEPVATKSVSRTWLNNGPNLMLKGEGFYISYNPNTSATHMLTMLGNMLGGELEDGEETALCKEVNGETVFSILSGDFRKQYEKLIDKGYDTCYAYFKKQQPKYGNNWSTDEADR